MEQHVRHDFSHRHSGDTVAAVARRRRPCWRLVLVCMMLVLAISSGLVAADTSSEVDGEIIVVDADMDEMVRRPSEAAPQQQEDIVVAGGIDGRVYAINAWTGDVVWMFDSGGPMVDSSNCGVDAGPQRATSNPQSGYPRQEQHEPYPRPAATPRPEPWRTTTLEVEADGRSVVKQPPMGQRAVATTNVWQMVPSYDGRLYHIAGSRVQELDMTMADLIHANGPVRLVVDRDRGQSSADEILLFGEKETKIFSLDATRGLLEPFPITPQHPRRGGTHDSTSREILFGRASFKTKAVNAQNTSLARCFTISEYFLQFAEQSKCSTTDAPNAKSSSTQLPEQRKPEILVLPKDPDATHPDDEESVIAAYDPWTHEPLWEVQIQGFDVISVFGISPKRGATFYKWSLDGPSSSTATTKKKSTTPSDMIGATTKTQTKNGAVGEIGYASEYGESPLNKQLARALPRDWRSMGSSFRLRLLDGNYYLESTNERSLSDPARGTSGSSPSSTGVASPFLEGSDDEVYDDDDALAEDNDPHHFPRMGKRKRRVFWESMESNGKRGVFITYYHVGAMVFGITLGCVLIAWGCYVKGLSASLAQTAIKSIDHHPLFMSHSHSLTIELPGQEKITISSNVVSRSLLLDAAMRQQYPLLENGDNEDKDGAVDGDISTSTAMTVTLDPETEAALIEKFSRMTALEAAAMITGAAVAKNDRLQIEYGTQASTASTASTSSTSSSTSSSSTLSLVNSTSIASRLPTRHRAITNGESETSPSLVDCTEMTEDNDGNIVPVIEELEDSSSGSRDEPAADQIVSAMECVSEQSVLSIESADKSAASWRSDTTDDDGSSNHSSSSSSDGEGSESDSESSNNDNNQFGDESTTDVAVPDSTRKVSNASSLSSASSSAPVAAASTNEAEVLFPFVCQSRFVNEFVELSPLGKGGFGQVVLAENRLDGRKYAIKRVGLHLKNQTSKTLQKFLREVKILALLDHPNIVRYYQAWLEKIEDSDRIRHDADGSTNGGDGFSASIAPPRNYSMSNLLAPISELEFSGQQRSLAFYSEYGDDQDAGDDGFEWERDASETDSANLVWKEEDLIADTTKGMQRVKPSKSVRESGQKLPNRNAAQSPRGRDNDEDSSCYSTDRCDHWLYIQMQYCAGRTLSDYLALPNRPMEMSKLLKIFTQIASAIAHVHSCGLIHRDLKPANIFVADTEGDSIKLGDFGLSRYAANVNLATTTTTTTTIHEEVHTISNRLLNGQLMSSKWSVSVSNMSESNDVTAGVGTYLYASPEQVAGKKYNAKTDMYSLGMILFELCHERFGTTMERYITLRNARERNYPAEFQWFKRCPEIMEMLDRLLHSDPMERPDAADVVHWSQELYELSLAQQLSSNTMLRSPIHHGRSFNGSIPALGLELLPLPGAASSFSLQVEARMDSGVGLNHNLLKEICDLIAQVSDGRMEIKKCGLNLQQDGAQILDFVLDPHLSEQEGQEETKHTGLATRESLIKAIEELPGVRSVRTGF